MKSNIKIFLIATIFSALFLTSLQAEVWKYEKTTGVSGCGRDANSGSCFCNTNVARFQLMRGIYDSSNQRLQWAVDFKPGVVYPSLDPATCQPNSVANPSNMTAQGMFLVLNNGPMPASTSQGQYAILYMDWTNMTNPRISVYSYNGNSFVAPGEPAWFNKEKSYIDGSSAAGLQTPDRFLSNLTPVGSSTNPTGWIRGSSVSETGSGQERIIKVRLDLDLSAVNSHIPLYGTASSWEGMRFGGTTPPKIGYWNQFRYFGSTAQGLRYDGGWLSNWSPTGAGASWLDSDNATPQATSPKCKGFPTSPITVRAGQTLRFSGMSIVDGDTNTMSFSYSGAPNGMVISPSAGQIEGNEIDISGSWITSSGDVNASPYTITFNGTDQYDAQASCQMTVEVLPNNAPVITVPSSVVYTSLSCGGSRTSADLNWTVIDPDSYPLTTPILNWTTTCPNAVISRANTANANIAFDTLTNGVPTVCTATLTAFDGDKTTNETRTLGVAGCVRDCTGIINGVTTYDACGICGGNGKSCLDCSGTPFGTAKSDSCGVCNGSGLSCVKCVSTNISSMQLSIDGNALAQRKLIERVANRILTSKRSNRKSITQAKLAKVEAQSLYQEQWRTGWSLSSNQTSCENTSLCVTSSSTPVISTLGSGVKSLGNKLEKLLTIAKTDRSIGSREIAQFRSTSKKLMALTTKEISKLPVSQSICN